MVEEAVVEEEVVEVAVVEYSSSVNVTSEVISSKFPDAVSSDGKVCSMEYDVVSELCLVA